ncbi:MAG: CDP-alcohol phosphatidyltransferase family protein [Planctomycetota bacterium]|nr:CDP-alcohol phosphatidyltransferase family protein [Planctomycetota bacterium]
MTDDIIGKKRSHFLFVFLLTLLRGPLAISFAVLFLTVGPGWTRVVLGLFMLGAMELTDLLDGLVARRFDVVTEWGAALDPYMDSFSRLIVYWTLACVGLTLPLVPLVMALRDVTVAYCRIFLARAGHTVAANWSGKVKAVVQGVTAIVIVSEPIYSPLLGSWLTSLGVWVVIVVTLASAVQYVKQAAIVSLNPPSS